MEEKNFTQKLKKILHDRMIRQNELAKMLNVAPPTISNIINGRDRLGKKQALEWGKVLDVDPLWLMTQGEQGIAPDEDAPPTQVVTDPDVINIPILSPDSAGGFRPNDQADIEQYTIGTMPFNRQIAHTGDVVIPVYGDSMTPKYPAGSYILIRPIEAWREYIELGRSYVLELADWRRLIKIVRKGSDATHYTLDSYNVDYESNEIAKDFINNMWLVVASVTREEL